MTDPADSTQQLLARAGMHAQADAVAALQAAARIRAWAATTKHGTAAAEVLQLLDQIGRTS